MTEARSNEDEYRAQLLTAVLYGEQLPVVQAPDEPKEELAEEEEVETLDFFHMFSIRSKIICDSINSITNLLVKVQDFR